MEIVFGYLDGFIEFVVGLGAGNAAYLDGREEFEIVDFTGVEEGNGEGEFEEAYGVEVIGARVVGCDIAGSDVGGVEPLVESDGIAGRRHHLDGFNMKKGGCYKVIVAAAGSENEDCQNGHDVKGSFHIHEYICKKRDSFSFIICI